MKKVFTLMCLMIAINACPAEKSVDIDGLKYSLRGGEFVVVSDNSDTELPPGDIIIKDYVEIDGVTYPVSVIECIASAEGRKVIIPQTVKEVWTGLRGAVLDELPSSLEACRVFAFTESTLPEAVSLPSIKDLGPNSFMTAKGVKKITLGPDICSFGAYAFSGTEISEIVFKDGEQSDFAFISNWGISFMPYLEELKLPKWGNLTLGDCAVAACENLKRVIFPDVQSIEYGYCQYYSDLAIMMRDVPVYGFFFCGCPKLKEIVCLGETPIEITDIDNFKEKNIWVKNTAEEFTFMDNMDGCVLKVPAGSEELYRTHPVWGRFQTILGFENGDYDLVSINSVKADENSEPVYYNLQGIQVKEPVKGQLYIRKAGAETAKVIM